MKLDGRRVTNPRTPGSRVRYGRPGARGAEYERPVSGVDRAYWIHLPERLL